MLSVNDPKKRCLRRATLAFGNFALGERERLPQDARRAVGRMPTRLLLYDRVYSPQIAALKQPDNRTNRAERGWDIPNEDWSWKSDKEFHPEL